MRFLFITDTHLGADNTMFQQQPAYPAELDLLLAGIRQILVEDPQIQFVLHGGDMIDSCSPETVKQAASAFQFNVPTFLSVGNHDLNHTDAEAIWLRHAQNLFASSNSLDYQVNVGNCILHIMPNHWEQGTRYYWKNKQIPCYTEEQLLRLKEGIRSCPEKIHLLSVHNPIIGILPDQTGLPDIIHDVDSDFSYNILDLIDRYPQLKLVLSGHNHVNTMHRRQEGVLLSGSSFIETPFEYKLIEIDNSFLRVTTQRLSSKLSFKAGYDVKKQYVQGRTVDRDVLLKW